jgi:uncharacterized protein GlcG (DUF336 family)
MKCSEEEYEVTPAVLDEDGNVVTEAVMGTSSVPRVSRHRPKQTCTTFNQSITRTTSINRVIRGSYNNPRRVTGA